jgi:hypothetical protein
MQFALAVAVVQVLQALEQVVLRGVGLLPIALVWSVQVVLVQQEVIHAMEM